MKIQWGLNYFAEQALFARQIPRSYRSCQHRFLWKRLVRLAPLTGRLRWHQDSPKQCAPNLNRPEVVPERKQLRLSPNFRSLAAAVFPILSGQWRYLLPPKQNWKWQ